MGNYEKAGRDLDQWIKDLTVFLQELNDRVVELEEKVKGGDGGRGDKTPPPPPPGG
jgi:hypothetical protein